MNKHKLCLIYNPVARGEKARLLDSELHFIAQEVTILGSKKSGDGESLESPSGLPSLPGEIVNRVT